MFQTTHYKALNGVKAIKRWVIPYLNSRIHSNQFRPVLCYLFTEWRCNIDCYYCFQYNNDLPGMDMETAKSSIDWLRSIGCRVIPIMGGEPLLRKDFILDVIRYGVENGFFMYLPTNGYLMDKVIKVSFIEYVGRRKKVTRVEVKESELDSMIKEKDNSVAAQLSIF